MKSNVISFLLGSFLTIFFVFGARHTKGRDYLDDTYYFGFFVGQAMALGNYVSPRKGSSVDPASIELDLCLAEFYYESELDTFKHVHFYAPSKAVVVRALNYSKEFNSMNSITSREECLSYIKMKALRDGE